MVVEWSASRLYLFALVERAPGTHWIWRWVGRRAHLDTGEEKKPRLCQESKSATCFTDLGNRIVTLLFTGMQWF
jgi:hypothetical protein